jgi:hypothetical protein
MKQFIMALWTAIALAFLESFISVIVENTFDLIQCHFAGYQNIENVVPGPGYEIFITNLVIFVARFYYGFIPVTAVVLFLGRMWDRPLHWSVLGLINAAVILVMCAVYNPILELYKSILHFNHEWAENICSIPIVISFFSPLILSKFKIGTILPDLVLNKTPPTSPVNEQ